jgi:hypothetical protein
MIDSHFHSMTSKPEIVYGLVFHGGAKRVCVSVIGTVFVAGYSVIHASLGLHSGEAGF